MNQSIPILLDRDEVAAIVGLHPESIKRAEQAGKLRALKFGHKTVRYHPEDGHSWLNSARHAAGDQTPTK